MEVINQDDQLEDVFDVEENKPSPTPVESIETQVSSDTELESSEDSSASSEATEEVFPFETTGEEEQDGRSWYVVHCYSGYENKVRHNLEQRIETMGMKDKIFDVVVPTEEEIEVREGKRRTVERRVFPG